MLVPTPQVSNTAIADEAELVSRAVQKDERAVRTLIQRYNRRLYRLARSVVRDGGEAEDVLQEAYLRAFTSLADFRGDASFSTWLTRIVINEALQRIRRRTDVPVPHINEDVERGRAEIIPFPASHATLDPE